LFVIPSERITQIVPYANECPRSIRCVIRSSILARFMLALGHLARNEIVAADAVQHASLYR
jgi:hypothetical protein